MRWIKKAVFVLSIFAAGALPVSAGWQWTEWGMSEQQVRSGAPIALASATASTTQLDEQEVRLIGSYSAAGIEFVARFWFHRTNGLSSVVLRPINSDNCAMLPITLKGIYGQPYVQDIAPVVQTINGQRDTIWTTGPDGVAIRFSGGFVGCEIVYWSGKPAGDDGGL